MTNLSLALLLLKIIGKNLAGPLIRDLFMMSYLPVEPVIGLVRPAAGYSGSGHFGSAVVAASADSTAEAVS